MERQIEQEPGREPAAPEAKQLGDIAREIVTTLGPVAVDETTGPARANDGAGNLCVLYGVPFDLHAASPRAKR